MNDQSSVEFDKAVELVDSDIPDLISLIIQMLYFYSYSYKALYVAQDCLVKAHIQINQIIKELRNARSSIVRYATEMAIEAKMGNQTIPAEIKKDISHQYKVAQNYEYLIRQLRQARWYLRYVGDGIAWHALRFERPLIRTLGSKEPVGIPENETLLQYRKIARSLRRVTKRKGLPIIHDLTNCLRTGDISSITGIAIKTIELKIRENKRKSGTGGDRREQRQKVRGQKILEYLRTGQMEKLYPKLKGGKLYVSKVVQRHNFSAISEALKEARAKSFGLIKPENGLLYMAFDTRLTNLDTVLDEAMKAFPEIFGTLFTFRSISPRVDEYHDSLPITAMELPAQDILDILFHRFGVMVFLNYQALQLECERHGLKLQVNATEGRLPQLLIEGEPKIEIHQGSWDKIMLEAFSLETLVEQIKEIKEMKSDLTKE